MTLEEENLHLKKVLMKALGECMLSPYPNYLRQLGDKFIRQWIKDNKLDPDELLQYKWITPFDLEHSDIIPGFKMLNLWLEISEEERIAIMDWILNHPEDLRHLRIQKPWNKVDQHH